MNKVRNFRAKTRKDYTRLEQEGTKAKETIDI